MEAPTRPTTCDRCGKAFNTSDQHPRRYCSIACEEGRSAMPIEDPASEGYHLYLRGEPEALIGKKLIVKGLKRTCYSPDWHRSPSDYRQTQIVSHDDENEIMVYETDIPLGTVTHIHDGRYCVEWWDDGEQKTQYISPSVVVEKIKREEWWVEQ